MPVEDNGAGWKARATSQSAAQKVKAPTMRERVLEAVRAAGRPISPDEVADALGKSILSVRPRFSELADRGLIRDTGQRGKTDEGRSCILWAYVPNQGRLL